jgi:hypothetical protein
MEQHIFGELKMLFKQNTRTTETVSLLAGLPGQSA